MKEEPIKKRPAGTKLLQRHHHFRFEEGARFLRRVDNYCQQLAANMLGAQVPVDRQPLASHTSWQVRGPWGPANTMLAELFTTAADFLIALDNTKPIFFLSTPRVPETPSAFV